MTKRCRHLIQAWDDDFLRCADDGTLLGKAYPQVEDGDALYVVFDDRHYGVR